jgi:hypothetical protein
VSEEEQRRDNEEEIRYSTNDTRFVLRRDQYTPGCWIQGGTLECFSSVGWALIELAELRGIPTNPNTMDVEKVRAARVGRQSRIWIHPTLPTDIEGTPVKRDKQGHMTISLYKFLAREKLLIAVGKRERFELTVVTGPDSPVGPALRLDFMKPLETKVIPPKKKEA